MKQELKRRLAAILALDIAGYSRMMGADERGTLGRLLQRRQTAIDAHVTANRGRVVKGTGDGILAEFASAQDAIRAAIAIQRALAAANAREPAMPPMNARIGINVGDVLFEQGDVFGDGVNVAARLESAAPAGGICVSGRVIDEVRRVGIPFEDHGEIELKNIAAPIRVYSIAADAIRDFAAEEPVAEDGGHKIIKRGWRRSARPLLGILAVLTIFGAVLAWWLAPAAPARPIVLVEPLGAPAADQRAQLLSQSLSSDLDRMIVGGNATVHIADASDNADAGGRQADFRLAGNARTDGNMLHASVRLLGSGDERILWSSDFARPVGESDALREQIAARVADVLTCALGSDANRRSDVPVDTLRLYLAGCEVRHTDWATAAGFFRQVTERSPGFAEAWAYYAVTLSQYANDQPRAEAPAIRIKVRAAAARALALDPKSAETYFALNLTTPYLKNWNAKEQNIARGLRLDPNNPELLTSRFYGSMSIGRVHDAVPFARRAMEMSPFSPVYAGNLAEVLAYSDQLADARKVLDRARERWAHEPFSEVTRFEIEAQVGDPATAMAILDDPGSTLSYEPASVAGWRALIAARTAGNAVARDRAAARIIAAAPTAPPFTRLEYAEHLVQLGRLDDAFAIAEALPPFATPVEGFWFRNYMAPFRRDPRFMRIAARQDIASIWITTGKWPDFCAEDTKLRYRCKDEARRSVVAALIHEGGTAAAAAAMVANR